ncbi:hypothetical protein WA158_004905 [Blastocystis sp. Blastoise]
MSPDTMVGNIRKRKVDLDISQNFSVLRSGLPLSFGVNSTNQTIINLIASILTSSGLSMPYLMSRCGILLGTIFTIFSMLIAIETSYYLTTACEYTKQSTYGRIVNILMGESFARLSNLLAIASSFCFSVSYFSTIFDAFPKLLFYIFHKEINKGFDEYTFKLITIFIVIFPILLSKSLNRFQTFDRISIIFSLLTVIYALFEGYHTYSTFPLPLHLFPRKNISYPRFIILILMWFNSHLSIPSIYREMNVTTKDEYSSKPEKMQYIIKVSYITCLFIYIIIGICGYIAFSENSSFNFLNSPGKKSFSTLFYLCKSSYILYSYISCIFCSYSSIHLFDTIFFSSPSSFTRQFFESIIWCISICYASIIIPSQNFITMINGCTCGLFLEIIIPSLLYLCINDQFKRMISLTSILGIPKNKRNLEAILASAIFIIFGVYVLVQILVE